MSTNVKRFSSRTHARFYRGCEFKRLGSSYISMKPLESVARVNPRSTWTFGATCGCTVATCRRYRWNTKIVGCVFGTRDTNPCNHYVVVTAAPTIYQNFRRCWRQIQRMGKSTWAASIRRICRICGRGPSRLPVFGQLIEMAWDQRHLWSNSIFKAKVCW